ncbi:MAG: hypothetical protein SWN98_11825 [Pseudomonadota bacterium]|nr:hypothetical protein [Pseudomonadota bacterium]
MSRRLLISCRNVPELPGLSEESAATRRDQPDEIVMPSASHGIDLKSQSSTKTTDGMIFAPFCPTPRTNRKKRLGQRALEFVRAKHERPFSAADPAPAPRLIWINARLCIP